jgi:hypothetical protein
MSEQRLEGIEAEKEPTTLRELLIALNDALVAVRPRTLFVNDAELIRRIGVPEKIAREALTTLDRDPKRTGFPQKSKLWGNRRYWPAVRHYFDVENGLAAPPFRSNAPTPESITASVRKERASRGDFDLKDYKSIFDK